MVKYIISYPKFTALYDCRTRYKNKRGFSQKGDSIHFVRVFSQSTLGRSFAALKRKGLHGVLSSYKDIDNLLPTPSFSLPAIHSLRTRTSHNFQFRLPTPPPNHIHQYTRQEALIFSHLHKVSLN